MPRPFVLELADLAPDLLLGALDETIGESHDADASPVAVRVFPLACDRRSLSSSANGCKLAASRWTFQTNPLRLKAQILTGLPPALSSAIIGCPLRPTGLTSATKRCASEIDTR